MAQTIDLLRESEICYHEILNAIPNGCQVIGFDWHYRYLNETAEKHNRRPNAELLGRSMMECWPGIRESQIFPFQKSCMEKRTTHKLETQYTFPDGHQRWYRVIIQPVREGIVVFSEDIDEHKQASAERRQYFTFFDTSADLMCIAEPNGAFKKVNPAFTKTLGYSETELVSRPFIEFVHPDDRQETLVEIVRQQQLGYTLAFENRYLRRDGSFLWLSWRAVYNENENSTYAIARDVTERKDAQRRHRENEERLSLVLRGSNDGFWDWNVVTNEVIYSQRWWNMLGYEENEIAGDPDLWRRLLHPEDKEEVEHLLGNALEGSTESYEIEYRLRHKSGQYVAVISRCFILRGADGKATRVSGTNMDITKRRQMEDNLLQYQDKLKLANEQLDQRVRERTAELESAIHEQESFSYTVSHDLRAPLRHINSFSAMLVEDFGADLPREARSYLDRICAASSRMGALIDHLLELSRMSRAELKLQPINLSELAVHVLTMFQETNPQRRVEIRITESINVLGDLSLFRMLLENLLGNAWKYTSKKPLARIEFGMTQVAEEEVFFVRDDGAGFDMAYQQRLFGAFERLHGSEFEGIGIGLATSQRIIKRHGGKIWAEGKVGEGATFYFTLPVYF